MPSSDDYIVEDHITEVLKIRKTYTNQDVISENEEDEDASSAESENESDHIEDHIEEQEPTNSRHILYVTNLSNETTKSMLEDIFTEAGPIRAIRIPKVRLGSYAFVEMRDFDGYKRGLDFNGREINGRKMHVFKGSKNKKHASVSQKNQKRKIQQQHLNTIKTQRNKNRDE